MLRLCLVIPLLLFVLFGCYPVQQKNLIKGSEPRVLEKNSPYTKDFGLLKAGEIARHSFTIKNNSNKVLNIKGVTTSCGCTGSVVKDKMLQPGKSTIVEVKFNSKGYSGPVQQFIYVNTDNPDNPIIRLIIKAKVTR